MMLRVRGVWGGRWIPVILIGLLTPVRPIISIVSPDVSTSRHSADQSASPNIQYMQTHYTPIAFGVPLYGCGAVFAIDRVLYTE